MPAHAWNSACFSFALSNDNIFYAKFLQLKRSSQSSRAGTVSYLSLIEPPQGDETAGAAEDDTDAHEQ